MDKDPTTNLVPERGDAGNNTGNVILDPTDMLRPPSVVESFGAAVVKICDISLELLQTRAEVEELTGQIAELEREIEELHPEATNDKLTGCYNRNAFEKYIEKRFDADRHDQKVGLMFMDINGLKGINDTLGHSAGDKVLKNTVGAIRAHLRGNIDEVNLYRMGGDEFVVVFEDPKSEDPKKFKKLLEERIQMIRESNPDLDFASGAAVFDRELDESLYDTIERADGRMYKDKHGIVQPPDQLVFFESP